MQNVSRVVLRRLQTVRWHSIRCHKLCPLFGTQHIVAMVNKCIWKHLLPARLKMCFYSLVGLVENYIVLLVTIQFTRWRFMRWHHYGKRIARAWKSSAVPLHLSGATRSGVGRDNDKLKCSIVGLLWTEVNFSSPKLMAWWCKCGRQWLAIVKSL